MTPEGRLAIQNMLYRDEGYRQFAYRDTTGHLTIGIGRNISEGGEGLSLDEAHYLLTNDINRVEAELKVKLPFFKKLNEPRQLALINMAFNMGVGGLLEFNRMLACLETGDYAGAAADMKLSVWADQVGARETRLQQIILTGEL